MEEYEDLRPWNKIFTPITLCNLAYGDNVSDFNGKPEEIRVANEVIRRVQTFLEENYELPKPINNGRD